MRFITDTLLNAVDASAATQTSAALDTSYMVAGSVQVVAVGAGTPTGALKIQASNDAGSALSGASPTNWTDITSQTVSVAGAGTYLIPKVDLCYQWIRVVYTKASGTGTITANFKGIGF
jgi:hypothetical protein